MSNDVIVERRRGPRKLDQLLSDLPNRKTVIGCHIIDCPARYAVKGGLEGILHDSYAAAFFDLL